MLYRDLRGGDEGKKIFDSGWGNHQRLSKVNGKGQRRKERAESYRCGGRGIRPGQYVCEQKGHGTCLCCLRSMFGDEKVYAVQMRGQRSEEWCLLELSSAGRGCRRNDHARGWQWAESLRRECKFCWVDCWYYYDDRG